MVIPDQFAAVDIDSNSRNLVVARPIVVQPIDYYLVGSSRRQYVNQKLAHDSCPNNMVVYHPHFAMAYTVMIGYCIPVECCLVNSNFAVVQPL